MKYAITITLAGLIIALAGATDAIAEDRYRQYEMSDGNYILFKMSPAEIQAEEAEKSRRAALKQKNARASKQWVSVFELPDGSGTVEFPMTEAEIRSAQTKLKLEAERKKAIHRALVKRNARTVTTVIEMADGHTVTFTKPMDSEDRISLLTRMNE